MNYFDTVVIGLGGWGSAALYHLARRGQKVCGLEQFSIGHDRGSSHGESRVIRMAYFLHPDYVPVLERAYELWRILEAEYREPLMTLNGLLCYGPSAGELIQGLERCYATHTLPHERFDAAEAMRRFPQFRVPEDNACFWDPRGGYVLPEESLRAHLQGAQIAGATLLQGEPVLAIEHERGGVTVRTPHRSLRAGKAILCGGAFTSRLLPGPGAGAIRPLRKVLFWYGMSEPAEFAPDRFPTWIAEHDGREFYGFPSLDRHGVKAAEHSGGQPLEDPTRVKRELQPGDEEPLQAFLQGTFAHRLRERQRHRTCLYEQTADQHFIVDRHPELEHLIVAAGGSGHGYKFCPAIGEMAADLAMHGAAPGRPEIFAARGRL